MGIPGSQCDHQVCKEEKQTFAKHSILVLQDTVLSLGQQPIMFFGSQQH